MNFGHNGLGSRIARLASSRSDFEYDIRSQRPRQARFPPTPMTLTGAVLEAGVRVPAPVNNLAVDYSRSRIVQNGQHREVGITL